MGSPGSGSARHSGHLSLRSESEPGHDIVFGDGFPTKSGRGRLRARGNRAPAEEPNADYPMVLKPPAGQLEHGTPGQ